MSALKSLPEPYLSASQRCSQPGLVEGIEPDGIAQELHGFVSLYILAPDLLELMGMA